MGHLRQSVHIDAPTDKIVHFTEDPHNWATFMAGMKEPERIVGEIGVGQSVEFTTNMAGVPLHEIVRTVEQNQEPSGSHWRGEMTGGTSGWMTMDFRPEDGGSIVTQEMEYTVPGSILGKVADRLVIERMMEHDMLHSLENLKLLMEAPSV